MCIHPASATISRNAVGRLPKWELRTMASSKNYENAPCDSLLRYCRCWRKLAAFRTKGSQGAFRERCGALWGSAPGTSRRPRAWIGAAAIEGLTGRSRDIGRLPTMRRSAQLRAIAVFRDGASGRLRHPELMDQDDRKLRDKPDQRKAEEHRLGSAVSPWYHTILLQYGPPPAASCDCRSVYPSCPMLACRPLLSLIRGCCRLRPEFQ
jgi:hypothetical protein